MACRAHGNRQAFLAPEVHRLGHVRGIDAAGDERRPPVDRGVEHRACSVVPVIGGVYDISVGAT